MTGASRGFSRAAAPVWGFSRGTMGSSGSLSCGAGEVRSSCAWRGGARHFSPVMVGESGLKTREEGLSRFFSGYGRKPWVPSTYARDLRELFRVPLRSQGYCAVGRGRSELHWVWCSRRGPYLELRQEPHGSSPFLNRISVSMQSWDRRVRPRLVWRNLTPLASRVVHGVTGHLSICMWNLRAFPTIHEGVRPLRFVPSSTGLPSKRCPSIGFLSRADREIGVFRRVAPTTRLRLEFPRETGLILRCAGKVRNPFQTKQGNRPSRRDQEGIRGSEQAVHRTLVFPSSETRVSGNFCANIKVANYRFKLQDGTWGFS